MTGKKHDIGKPRWDLMPFGALENVVRVLNHGADKYGDDNWKSLPDAENRYFAAAMRHLVAWREGRHMDQESGLPHLAHAVCSLLFVLAIQDGRSTADISRGEQQ